MIQAIPRVVTNTFAGAVDNWYYPIFSGWGITSEFTVQASKIVMPIEGIFRNLATSCVVPGHPNYSITLVVNGVDTSLVATVGTGQDIGYDSIHQVTVSIGDEVAYKQSGAHVGATGIATCNYIEFEGDACFYGMNPSGASHSVGDAGVKMAGALGNGVWMSGGGITRSNTFSLCAINGTITRIQAKDYTGSVLGTDSWTVRLRKNGVTQDGTGGTVDTSCVITGSETTGFSVFELPVVLGDILDYALFRGGTTQPFVLASVACSLRLDPTTSGEYMMCGGDNDALNVPDWKWNDNEQGPANEQQASALVGVSGFQARGLAIYLSGGIVDSALPAIPTQFIFRKNFVDTAIQLTIPAGTRLASMFTNVDLVNGDYVNIKFLDGEKAHWGLAAKNITSAPSVGTGGGLFWINPNNTHDTYYDMIRKIPDPTIKTALIGE